jgi:ribonuclease HI
MNKSELTIYTDGAAKGNPGPAGVGIIIYRGKKTLKKTYNYIGKTTNNVAEYTALIYALQEALYLNADKVTIFSDSELMVKQIKGEYKVKNHALRVFNGIAKHVIEKFTDFNINYVPREENKEADLLANKAINEKTENR